MTTIDELESRLRFVEADVASEKEISLATLQQSVRNGAVLNGLRAEVSAATTRVDQLVADAAIANSTLRHHSTLLAVLQQDVTAFRQDVTALRRAHEELHVRFDRAEERLDQFQAEVATRFDRLESSVTAILAAVAPQKPPAA
jgi:chromosome segregation ATPase